MDIYIIRDGQESGPFSDQAAQELLEQGNAAATDFACRTGMDRWVPLSELLVTAPQPTLPTLAPAPLSEGKVEPATAKQRALITYLGIALPADLTRDQAARHVNDAMEDPAQQERLTMWNGERLRLHPELFADEIQAKKENRANHFLELCESTGAEYFSGVTKAHCQVLVGFLDVKFPNWDARQGEAAEHYFFPAVAEKFPQLVHKQWRGRLRYVEAMKVAPEMVQKSPTTQLRRTATSPLVAVTRGIFLGIVILAVLYLGYRTMHHDVALAPQPVSPAATKPTSAEPTPAVAAEPTAPPTVTASPTVSTAKLPAKLASIAPIEPIAPVEPAAAPEPAPAAVVASNPPLASAPAAVSPTGMVTFPAVGIIPGSAGVAPSPPPPASLPDPAMTATNPSPVAPVPTLPALPASEPPVPVPPPPATLPAAGTIASAPPPAALPSGLPFGLPSAPPVPPPAALPSGLPPGLPMAPEAPPSTIPGTSEPGAKTSLVLTKPVEVQIGYGKIKLPPGTQVKLVSRQGASLKVSYRNAVITVPVASTDLE